MLKKIAVIVTAITIGMSMGYANAHEGYGGLNLAFVEYSDRAFNGEASLDGVYGRLGAQVTEIVSFEVRAGFGVDDDTVASGLVEVDLDTLFGVYFRGGFPITEVVYPYAIIGYTRGEVDLTIPGFGSSSRKESDVSWGGGVDFNLDQNLALNVEYMNWYDEGDAEIDGFSVGVVFKF